METLSRPQPPRRVPDRVREWIDWFGPSRIITSVIGVVVVCGGAFWLVRTGPPPGEASLPVATASVAGPPATWPPPASVVPDPAGAAGGAADGAADGAGGGAGGEMVTVHVAGAVVSPGVYVFEAGARVDAAVAVAGGVVADGDPDALNLAALLVDGTRIYVPIVGEVVTTPAPFTPGAPDAPVAVGPLNLNQASAGDLEMLPGIGPATATAIVAERERNGPFLGVDDLERVPGIGPAKMSALRDLVTT